MLCRVLPHVSFTMNLQNTLSTPPLTLLVCPKEPKEPGFRAPVVFLLSLVVFNSEVILVREETYAKIIMEVPGTLTIISISCSFSKDVPYT